MSLPTDFDNILILTILFFLLIEGVEDMTSYITLFILLIS